MSSLLLQTNYEVHFHRFFTDFNSLTGGISISRNIFFPFYTRGKCDSIKFSNNRKVFRFDCLYFFTSQYFLLSWCENIKTQVCSLATLWGLPLRHPSLISFVEGKHFLPFISLLISFSQVTYTMWISVVSKKKKKKVIWWSLLGRYITLHEDHGKWGIGGSRNEIQMLNFKENDTWVKETSTRKQSNSDMEEIDNSLEHESSTLKS